MPHAPMSPETTMLASEPARLPLTLVEEHHENLPSAAVRVVHRRAIEPGVGALLVSSGR